MTTSHSLQSTTTRKIVWSALILLTVTAAACGGSTQAMTGTAPSAVSSLAAATDDAGSFGLLKEGKGKSGHSPEPEDTTAPTTPDPEDADGDVSEIGPGHGHGKAAIQIEGFTTDIDSTCPELIIDINGLTVHTVATPELTTEFQRAACETLANSTAPSIHLHIAAKRMEDGTLVATYVRMQGPKGDDEENDEEEDTTSTTETTSTP